jgi:hypothetical protein
VVLRRWYEDAAGRLMWSPDRFWRSTLAEFIMAVSGWNRAQMGGVEPMSRERMNELIKDYGQPSYSIIKKKTDA